MSHPDKERRHAALVVLYVLGTLLLFLLSRTREEGGPLRWSERREGELRDALASAAAPYDEDEPGPAEDEQAAEELSGGRSLIEPDPAAEAVDGLRLDEGPAGPWDMAPPRCR